MSAEPSRVLIFIPLGVEVGSALGQCQGRVSEVHLRGELSRPPCSNKLLGISPLFPLPGDRLRGSHPHLWRCEAVPHFSWEGVTDPAGS